MSSARVVQSASWQSASWRIRELSSNRTFHYVPRDSKGQYSADCLANCTYAMGVVIRGVG